MSPSPPVHPSHSPVPCREKGNSLEKPVLRGEAHPDFASTGLSLSFSHMIAKSGRVEESANELCGFNISSLSHKVIVSHFQVPKLGNYYHQSIFKDQT